MHAISDVKSHGLEDVANGYHEEVPPVLVLVVVGAVKDVRGKRCPRSDAIRSMLQFAPTTIDFGTRLFNDCKTGMSDPSQAIIFR